MRVAAAVALSVFALAAACKKSSAPETPTPEVTGLAAVPASAQVVIGIDVAKVASSPLVDRAVTQLLARDAELAERWTKLHDSCKLDLGKTVKRVMLAIGKPPAGDHPGTGPTVMIATGAIVEADLAACVRAMVGQGGGALTARPLEGRTLYQAKDGARTMFFAFGRADTVVLGSNEAFVTEALGSGKKVSDDPEMKHVISLVDQNAPIWAAGRVDERVRAGLVKVTAGKVASGPSAMVATVDPTDGAKLHVGVVMSTEADAKALESFAKAELGVLAMAAQVKSLQPVVDKVAVVATAEVVSLDAALTIDDVNQLLSALDVTPPPAQDSPPPPK
jgi:hypothetical protein